MEYLDSSISANAAVESHEDQMTPPSVQSLEPELKLRSDSEEAVEVREKSQIYEVIIKDEPEVKQEPQSPLRQRLDGGQEDTRLWPTPIDLTNDIINLTGDANVEQTLNIDLPREKMLVPLQNLESPQFSSAERW